MGDGWIVAAVLGGLCVLSALWTFATAPGFNVRDKHVFLSGGTKGLGLAIAKKYARAGARLSLVGRSLERLERANAEIQQAADNVSIFLTECDISDHEQVERAIAAANEFHGRATDHVVHAAVVVKPGYAWVQDPSQLRHDMGVTYFGAVNMFKARHDLEIG
ncbi:3-ketodihydrosphingosine reductase, partial [Globisporangium splendens]